jgi:RHS repeat-associated protein
MTATNYIWDFATDSYLMEKDDDGNTTAVYTNEPIQYGRTVSQRQGSTRSYYHFDGQGSTRQLTDQSEDVTDEYTYSAFGEILSHSGITLNPFTYNGSRGYYLCGEANVISIRARAYSPEIARWLSKDPLGYIDGMNLYSYLSNSPIVGSDPSGTWGDFNQACLVTIGGIPCRVAFVSGVCFGGGACTQDSLRGVASDCGADCCGWRARVPGLYQACVWTCVLESGVCRMCIGLQPTV